MASGTLAASATAVVWLTVGLVTTVAMIALLVALVRHVLLVGRAASRLQEEVQPLVAKMQRSSGAVRRGARAGS